MIDRLEALALGVIQGATEYLPVSSSGHLVIAQHLFGLPRPAVLFDVVLHLATLLVVVWYYRRHVSEMLGHSARSLEALWRGESWSEVERRYPSFRLAWLIALGTIPTALIGIGFEETFERFFGSIRTVGWMLMLTGLVLLLTRFAPRGDRRMAGIRSLDALLVGLAQGIAITPGISRSGITIGVALFLGIERETAARFSFLLAIPSIIGALLLKVGDDGNGVGTTAMALGFVAALVSGQLCLALLVRVVKRGKLSWFAPYCFAVGLAALALAARL